MLNNITLLQPLYPVFCTWCAGETNVVGYTGVPHSHGMCPACADRLLDEMDEMEDPYSEQGRAIQG